MALRSRLTVGILALCVLTLSAACDSLPSLPQNPFRVTPTVVPTPAPSPTPVPTVRPTDTPVAFRPFWIKNFKITGMWSGPAGQPGVISFGMTSSQFCSFQVVKPEEGSRLYVLNPYSKDYFWIDAADVGPVDQPEKGTGPKPPDQNCAEAIYD